MLFEEESEARLKELLNEREVLGFAEFFLYIQSLIGPVGEIVDVGDLHGCAYNGLEFSREVLILLHTNVIRGVSREYVVSLNAASVICQFARQEFLHLRYYIDCLLLVALSSG